RLLLPENLSVPVSGSARADAGGQFHIEIDAEGKAQGPIELLISAPNGLLVDRVEVALDEISKPLEISIEPEIPFTIEPSDVVGGCVDLTTPNRTLEEFSYFFVVRTSEPAVTRLTLGSRRTVPPDLLVDLLGVSLSAAALRGDRLQSASFGRADFQLDVDTA